MKDDMCSLNYVCNFLKEQVNLGENMVRQFSLISALSKNKKSELEENSLFSALSKNQKSELEKNEEKILHIRKREVEAICK